MFSKRFFLSLVVSILVIFLWTQNTSANTILFSDSFESENFSNWIASDSQWSVTSTSAHTGTKKAKVRGNTSPDPDILLKKLSTEGYASISFGFWFNAENLESGDTVVAQWTSDGSLWIDLVTISSGSDTNMWTESTFELPASAEDNPNFAVRFAATLNAANDVVDMDDVSVSGVKEALEDLIPPVGEWDQPASGSSVFGSVGLSLKNVSDDFSGIASATFEYKILGSSFYSYIATDLDDTDGWAAVWNTASISLGQYILRSVVQDQAGNATNLEELVDVVQVPVIPPVVNSGGGGGGPDSGIILDGPGKLPNDGVGGLNTDQVAGVTITLPPPPVLSKSSAPEPSTTPQVTSQVLSQPTFTKSPKPEISQEPDVKDLAAQISSGDGWVDWWWLLIILISILLYLSLKKRKSQN